MLDRPGAARSGDEDVARFHIAMDQALRVRGVERSSDVGDDRKHVIERNWGLVDQLSKIGALHVPHRDEQVAFLLTGVIDGKHVRLVERGGELGFADEAFPEPLVVRELGGEHLEGDLPFESLVLGEVHDTHAAPPEGAFDAVASELGSRCQVHRGRTLPYPEPGAGRSKAAPLLGGDDRHRNRSHSCPSVRKRITFARGRACGQAWEDHRSTCSSPSLWCRARWPEHARRARSSRRGRGREPPLR